MGADRSGSKREKEIVNKSESRGYAKGYQSAMRDIAWALEVGGVKQVKQWLADNTLSVEQFKAMEQEQGK